MATAKVPYVIGTRKGGWKDPLDAAGFKAKLTDRSGKSVKVEDALVVVDQSPAAGAEIDTDAGVTLIVDTPNG